MDLPIWSNLLNQFQAEKSRVQRFRQFISQPGFPEDSDIENYLHFMGSSNLVFESAEQVKRGQIYTDLYRTIFENLWAFGKETPTEIDEFVLLIDKIAMVVCVKLESVEADENKYLASLKKYTWSNKPFNLFQQCIFFKLCAIWMNINTGEAATTKQGLIKRLLENEGDRIGHSIGFYMPLLSFSGTWLIKKDDQVKQSSSESKQVTISKDTAQNKLTDMKQKDVTQKITPIWWKKSDRLLGYLFDQLMKHDLIDKDTASNLAIKEHFINKNKEPFGDSIKQNRSGATNINKNNKPKGAEIVDEIIKAMPKE